MFHRRKALASALVIYAVAGLPAWGGAVLDARPLLLNSGAVLAAAALAAALYLWSGWRLVRRAGTLPTFVAAVAFDRGGFLWARATGGHEPPFGAVLGLDHVVTAALVLTGGLLWWTERERRVGHGSAVQPPGGLASAPSERTAALPRVNVVEAETGRFLLFAGADMVSESLYRTGGWEPLTLAIAQRLLDARGGSGAVIDCGANVGAFTIPVARRLPRASRVVSFEVQRAVYHQLCGAVVLNRLDNVIAHQVGLAAEAGRTTIPLPDYHSDANIGGLSVDPSVRRLREDSGLGASTDRGGGTEQEVELQPLDAFGITDALLVKIDVEGMELSVLRGAAETLSRSGFPPLLFELWDTQALPVFGKSQRELLSYVKGLGYEVQRVGDLGVAQHVSQTVKLDLAEHGARAA